MPANAKLAGLDEPVPTAATPIYIELRALVSQAFPPLPAMPTIETFWRYVREQLLPGALASFEAELLTLVRKGGAILLLDGLDEIPQADDGRRRQ